MICCSAEVYYIYLYILKKLLKIPTERKIMLKVIRSESKMYWQVIYNGVVLETTSKKVHADQFATLYQAKLDAWRM